MQMALFEYDAEERAIVEPVQNKELVILLDLNFTLVENSFMKRQQGPISYSAKIGLETYRRWLVDLVRGHTVLLCTVRHRRYKDQTLAHIEGMTGWRPEHAFFNPTDDYRGWVVKREYLDASILPMFGAVGERPYLAIESARDTRAMYASLGIPAYPVPKTPWTRLPVTG
jgi:hypothetical protein